jgi:hypothetical protein
VQEQQKQADQGCREDLARMSAYANSAPPQPITSNTQPDLRPGMFTRMDSPPNDLAQFHSSHHTEPIFLPIPSTPSQSNHNILEQEAEDLRRHAHEAALMAHLGVPWDESNDEDDETMAFANQLESEGECRAFLNQSTAHII